jgi:hypothetical protein
METIIDNNLLFRGLKIQKGVLYVKGILSQPVVMEQAKQKANH